MAQLAAELGRIAGQNELILQEFTEAREARKEQYQSMERVRQSVSQLDARMVQVEASITGFTPTIQEFISIKQKVIGAGRLGKWLWVVGVALITLIYNFRGELATWFGR